jgi:hypothetical protein
MQITSGSTTTKIPVLMVSTSDDKTAVTGATVTIQISKNGGAFATCSGSVSEIANGWYIVTLSGTETGTAGPLLVRATATSADEWRDYHQVV